MSHTQKKSLINNNIIMSIILVTILTISIFSFKMITTAKDNHIFEKHFKTIEISKGDTLSTLASKYAPEHNTNRYIKEIKSINNLESDTIHEGCYLVIPVYTKTKNAI